MHLFLEKPLALSVAEGKRNTGGRIVEQATHLVDLCRYIVGEITTVYTMFDA